MGLMKCYSQEIININIVACCSLVLWLSLSYNLHWGYALGITFPLSAGLTAALLSRFVFKDYLPRERQEER
jgi:hypothetical protein